LRKKPWVPAKTLNLGQKNPSKGATFRHDWIMCGKQDALTGGNQQICPAELIICSAESTLSLDVLENSCKYVHLVLGGEICKLEGTLNKNSQTKVLIRVNNPRCCQLEAEFSLHGDAKLEIVCLVEKCQNVCLNQKIRLLGERSHAMVYNACRARESENISVHSSQIHLAPRSKSSVLTNSVLDGHSTADIVGMINVSENSQGSESEQYVKTIALSDDSEANMAPHLSILAKDIVCKHGAASGGLDEAAMLYMQSRGILPIQSKKMLADGFIFSGFDKFRHQFWAECLPQLKENS
jgi:hypothetical protein